MTTVNSVLGGTIYKSRSGDKAQYPQYPEHIANLRTIFESMTSKHDKPLSKSSVDNYTGKLNKLSCVVLGHGFDGSIDWLLKPQFVISKLTNANLSGAKDYISPIVKLLKMKDVPASIITEYQKAMTGFKDDESAIRKTNKASVKETKNSLSLPDILRRINDFKPDDDMGLIYKLICSIYFSGGLTPKGTEFVPRNDLPLMKLVSVNKKANTLNPDFNYITLDKNNTPIDFILINYKSRNTYGRQKFTINSAVRELLKQYINLYGKKTGDYLFVMKNGEPFSKANFSGLIEQATKAVLGKPMGVDLMRSIQISHYYNDGAHSIADDEADAHRYLHSANMHKEYLKLGLVGDD